MNGTLEHAVKETIESSKKAMDETNFNRVNEYEVRRIPGDDAAVRIMRARFFAHYNLTLDEPNPALSWFGVFNTRSCLVVFAIGVLKDGGVEGTDFYVLPTKEGARAAAWTLTMARILMDARVAPYFYMWVLGRNLPMRRRLEKVFGITEPRSVLYSYGSK